MFANHPEMAKRWAEHTDSVKKLPEKKIEEGKKAAFVERNIVSSLAKIAAQTTLMGYGQNNVMAKPSQPQPKLNQTSSRNINVNKNPNPPAPTGTSVVPRGGAEQYGSNYFEAIKAKAEQAKQQPAQQKQGFITKLAQYGGGLGLAKSLTTKQPEIPTSRTDPAKPVALDAPPEIRAAKHPVLQEAFKGTQERLPDETLSRMNLSSPEMMDKAKTMWARRSFLPGYSEAVTNDPSKIITDKDVTSEWERAHKNFLGNLSERQKVKGFEQGDFGLPDIDSDQWKTNYLDLARGQGPADQVETARQVMQEQMAKRLSAQDRMRGLSDSLRAGREAEQGFEEKLKTIGNLTHIDEDYARKFSDPKPVLGSKLLGAGSTALEGAGRLYSSPLGSLMPGGGAGALAKNLVKGTASAVLPSATGFAGQALKSNVPSWLNAMAVPGAKATQLTGLTGNAVNNFSDMGLITPQQGAAVNAAVDIPASMSGMGYGWGPFLTGAGLTALNTPRTLQAMDPTNLPWDAQSPNRMMTGVFGSPEDKARLIGQRGIRDFRGETFPGVASLDPSSSSKAIDRALPTGLPVEFNGGVPGQSGYGRLPSYSTFNDAVYGEAAAGNAGTPLAPGAVTPGSAVNTFMPEYNNKEEALDVYSPDEMLRIGVPVEAVDKFNNARKAHRALENIINQQPQTPENRLEYDRTRAQFASDMVPALDTFLGKKYETKIKHFEDFATTNLEAIRAATEKSASGQELTRDENELLYQGVSISNEMVDYSLNKAKVELLKTGTINSASLDAFFNPDKAESVRSVMKLLRPMPNGELPPIVEKAHGFMKKELEQSIPKNVVPTGSTRPPEGTTGYEEETSPISADVPAESVGTTTTVSTPPPPAEGATVADAGNAPPKSAPAGAVPDGAEKPKEEPKGIIDTYVNNIWGKMNWWEQIMTIAGVGMAAVSAFAGITGTGGGWLSMLGILGGVAGLAPSLLRMVGLENLFGGGNAPAAEPPVEGLTLPTERDAAATNPDEVFQQVDENGQNPQPVTQAPIPFDEFQSQLVDQYSKGSEADKAEAIKSFWNRAKTDQDFMNQLKEIQKGLAENKNPITGGPMPIVDPAKDYSALGVRGQVIAKIVGESKKKGVPVSPEAAAILVDNWKQNVAPTIK